MNDRYINRELSWLDFNSRVLALAENPGVPLLERARFLAIWSSNLDEFYQVRVAGLHDQVGRGIRLPTPDGLTPLEALGRVRDLVDGQYERAGKVFITDLAPRLAAAGIGFSDYSGLDTEDRHYMDAQFRERVYPVVTPLAVDPSHPFPYISNLSLNLAVVVRNPESNVTRFARVKVPPILPRFVVLPDGERFVPLEQVIAAHIGDLFPGMEIREHHAFRVTRNADLEIEQEGEEEGDLLLTIESELTRRRFGKVVRLEVAPDLPAEVLELLLREMGASEDQVYTVEGPLDLGGLATLTSLPRDDLKYASFNGVVPARMAPVDGVLVDVFRAIRSGPVMVHHPYDAFAASTEAFIAAAARDPRVLAIKQTLYRTSSDSPMMQSLMHAANEGKQVVALVELKARFDEERNIEWAQRLEDVGVHVVYGVAGLKTHTKISLVVRDEGDTIRRYCHIGTGNYNETTARVYEDLGLLTADPDIGADLSDLFNFLTGYSRQRSYRKLAVSPEGVRSRLVELIQREASAADGNITMKMNSLVDQGMIDALYAASEAGTRIDLIVRGICCLIPGVPGMSSNIRVRSIVGRYLEHSRIFRFGSRPRDRVFLIGSADLMPRNLDRRVEALTPVEDADLQFRLDEIIEVLMADDELAWELGSDGIWTRVATERGVDAHETLQGLALARARAHI
ncbi:MAG TPA: polyphosphate kinase 1 [Acidimicrobiia bacterium]|nr:polyphosphate kinase 1 [Acidimicrobiia bacterium]